MMRVPAALADLLPTATGPVAADSEHGHGHGNGHAAETDSNDNYSAGNKDFQAAQSLPEAAAHLSAATAAAHASGHAGHGHYGHHSLRAAPSALKPPATMTADNIYVNLYKDTTKRFNGIWHLIFIWKGSVFKLIWHDFLVFILAYAALNMLYRFVFFHDPVQREMFELICVYASKFSNLIPISFLTGFYVTQVVTRWWDQFMSLPWPDQIALKLVSYCPGKDHFRKNLRRTVMRYINLSTILVYRLVSNKVKERFPTYKELVDSKLMLPHEVDRLSKVDARTPHESTWTPILWAVKLLQRARTEGKISIEAPIFANLISSVDHVESSNRKILNYGWINFPLAYTQVATVSVYTYFLASLFGRQYLIPREESLNPDIFPHLNVAYSDKSPFDKHTPDFYLPFFTFVELLSYMGWIKVAETLLNPFGDDDEDFQINYIIDRNLQVSYLIVDEAEESLEMASDPFLEAGIAIPKDLPPYRVKSAKAPTHGTSTEQAGGGAPDTVSVTPSARSERSKLTHAVGTFRDSLRSRLGSKSPMLARRDVETASERSYAGAGGVGSAGDFNAAGRDDGGAEEDDPSDRTLYMSVQNPNETNKSTSSVYSDAADFNDKTLTAALEAEPNPNFTVREDGGDRDRSAKC